MKGNEPRSQSPRGLPVLTEVVVIRKEAQPPVSELLVDDFPDMGFESTVPAELMSWPSLNEPVPAATKAVSEQAVVERVLADLHKQLDLMFEHRLRETLSPVLARMTDTLVREMRNHLAESLREMVETAVALELDRHHKR